MSDSLLNSHTLQLLHRIESKGPTDLEQQLHLHAESYYTDHKKKRRKELLEKAREEYSGELDDTIIRRQTNLASAEASRKKKEYMLKQLRRILKECDRNQKLLAGELRSLLAVCENQRRELIRLNTTPHSPVTVASNGPPDIEFDLSIPMPIPSNNPAQPIFHQPAPMPGVSHAGRCRSLTPGDSRGSMTQQPSVLQPSEPMKHQLNVVCTSSQEDRSARVLHPQPNTLATPPNSAELALLLECEAFDAISSL